MSTEKRIDEVKKNLDECVARGVVFLNNKYPNWKTKVDWEKFKFTNSEECIAGQLGFYDSMDSLALVNLGFDVSIPFFNEFYGSVEFCPYTYLHDVWLTVRHMEINQNDKSE